MKKNIIFHFPSPIYENIHSGSQIRPICMINAFKNIGYKVDVVIGYGKERKEKINKIKENIKNGIKYDFLYSENSTLPTLLTEKYHIPLYPFLDFNFFKFCKKNGIKIGLFYRDIHWRFEHYKKNIIFLKQWLATIFYLYDLFMYSKLIDILYLPHNLMYKYIPYKMSCKIESLPPGNNRKNIIIKKTYNEFLTLFYVGGIGDLYDLEILFEVVNRNEYLHLIVCFRKNDWEKTKNKYKKYLNNRIQIIHKWGDDLENYYYQADLLILFVKPIIYWTFAMPVKLFEYLSYCIPIIGTKGTAVGDFIEDNNIGWNIEYSKENLTNLLEYIKQNRIVLEEKKINMKNILDKHTWEQRAKKVSHDLLN